MDRKNQVKIKSLENLDQFIQNDFSPFLDNNPEFKDFDKKKIIELVRLILFDQNLCDLAKRQEKDIEKLEVNFKEIIAICDRYSAPWWMHDELKKYSKIAKEFINQSLPEMKEDNKNLLRLNRHPASKKSSKIMTSSALLDLADQIQQILKFAKTRDHLNQSINIIGKIFNKIGMNRDIEDMLKDARKNQKKYPNHI